MKGKQSTLSESVPPESDIAPQFSHILLRDDWTCQQCGYEADPDEPMESVLTTEDGDPKNPENYDTLCEDCARNERHGFSARKQQRQQAINTENRLPSETGGSHIHALLLLPVMFWPAGYLILAPYWMVTGKALKFAAGMGVVLYLQIILSLPIAFGVLYLLLVVGSHLEPPNGVFTKVRYHLGGWIYYSVYHDRVKPLLSHGM